MPSERTRLLPFNRHGQLHSGRLTCWCAEVRRRAPRWSPLNADAAMALGRGCGLAPTSSASTRGRTARRSNPAAPRTPATRSCKNAWPRPAARTPRPTTSAAPRSATSSTPGTTWRPPSSAPGTPARSPPPATTAAAATPAPARSPASASPCRVRRGRRRARARALPRTSPGHVGVGAGHGVNKTCTSKLESQAWCVRPRTWRPSRVRWRCASRSRRGPAPLRGACAKVWCTR